MCHLHPNSPKSVRQEDKLMPVPLCASRDVSQGHGQCAVSPGPPILEKGSDQYPKGGRSGGWGQALFGGAQ